MTSDLRTHRLPRTRFSRWSSFALADRLAPGSGFSLAPRRAVVLPVLAIAVLSALGGCSGGKRVKQVERIEDGPMAAQRAAQADAVTDAASLQGTASIPSLIPGQGQIQLPAAVNIPETAPTGDNFDNGNAVHLLARCRDRAALRQWFDAVGDCRRAYSLDPSLIETQEELMKLLVTLQSYGDAEEAAEKVLAAKPNDPVALYYLAWSHRGREKYPQAISALQRAVAADPKQIEFVQALGLTYCLSDNYAKGIATLEQALTMRPGDTKTTDMIASARAVLADKLAPYQKLVQEKPDSYDNQAALGFMYQKYGLSQRALSAYDTALTKMPTPISEQDAETKKIAAQVFYNRGVVYRDLGRPELAEPALLQSIELEPSLAAFAWYYIGLCRYDAGKYGPSIEALRQSIDLAPDVADNREALADAYAKADKPSLAGEQRNAASAIRARVDAEKAAVAKESADAAKADRKAEAATAAAAGPEDLTAPASAAASPTAAAPAPAAATQP